MTATNWSLPLITDTIVNYTAEFAARDVSAMTKMRSSLTADTNIPTGAIRWNDTNFNWESWSGTAWSALATLYGISISGNAATASAVAWGGISSKPTTIAGYGITDIGATYATISSLSAYATTSSLSAYLTTSAYTTAIANYATLAAPALTGNATIDAIKIGYRNVPQNIQSGAYTFVLTDNGKHIYSANAGAQALTLPLNASVAFDIGTAITVVNNGTTAISFTTTGATVYKAGTSAAWASGGTLAIRGLATLMKVATDTWFISGAGLS